MLDSWHSPARLAIQLRPTSNPQGRQFFLNSHGDIRMNEPRKVGRPPNPAGRKPPGMHVSIPPDVAAQLSHIAEREGLTHGGQPSPAQAVRWLVAADQKEMRR